MSDPLPPRYDPREVEARLYPLWEGRGDFAADPDAVLSGKRRPFVVMIPPPNVTGALHMGHALNNTLQDVLCRWHRMLGDEVLWLPGIDHAGIATQAVVEKKLYEERRVRRLDMGRDAFLKEVWAWKEKYGGTILRQLRRLGCSCDWGRTKFTMDPDLSFAVRKVFVDLFEEGLVYRGARIVNWDCVLETAVSDDEVEHEDRRGKLWHVRYPRADGAGFVVVATTRPETMLGDTGVAVHPGDPRYRELVGKRVRLPLLDREIPVVADESVDPEFGTGAVKVTPGHDPADYERGKRHGLPILVVLDGKGRVTREGGPYEGLSREQARDRIVKDLEEQGLLDKVEDHALRVAVSDRSKSVIEPLVSEQWFVRMEALAAPAIAAAKDRTLAFRPERWTKVYLDWLENVRDWCISRQLWWGHRIPVWYDGDGTPCALLEDPAPGAKHPKTGKPLVRQDEDVLDTWASSWLWPLSTLGWPDRSTKDYRAFYPTQFLSTAREILYLWVARMVMAGYKLDGRCPFGTVYVHATILDAKGRRMSKSAGNGIDPVDMIDKYGADAVRFTLVDLTTEGQDVRLVENRFEVGRNFMNKLWNAGRYLQMHGAAGIVAQPDLPVCEVEDQWIMDLLAEAEERATDCLTRYQFHEYARILYEFTWDRFCSGYLEYSRRRVQEEDRDAIATARVVMGSILRLLHPVCPFVTEEVFKVLEFVRSEFGLAGEGELPPLSRLPWPARLPNRYPIARRRVDWTERVLAAVYTIRLQFGISQHEWLEFAVRLTDEAIKDGLEPDDILRLPRLRTQGSARNAGTGIERPPNSAMQPLPMGVEVYVPLAGHIDLKAEKERLQKEIGKAEGLLASLDRKLANADFVARAKPEVVESERARRAEAAALVDRLRASLAGLQ